MRKLGYIFCTAFFFLFISFPFSVGLSFAAGAPSNEYADNLPKLSEEEPLCLASLEKYEIGSLMAATGKNYKFSENDSSLLQSELKKQLMKLGYKLQEIDLYNQAKDVSNKLNIIAHRQESNGHRKVHINALSSLQAQCVVVVPSIAPKMAEFSGAGAKWDGTRHTLRIKGTNEVGMWSGQRPVISLRLSIYSQNGEWLADSFGGVSIPEYAILGAREIHLKEELFSHRKDRKAMQKGVKKALWPLKKTFSAHEIEEVFTFGKTS